MSFNIAPFKIEPHSKRKISEEFSLVPVKKRQASLQATPIQPMEGSNYFLYLASIANRPLSNDYERFLRNRAVKEYLSGDLEEAVKTCHEILIKNPESFFAKKLRGSVYYQQKRDEEASVDLKQAFQAHPFIFEADPQFMIDACLKQNDETMALRILNYYLRRYPRNVGFLLLRAKLYLNQGKLDLVGRDLGQIQRQIDNLNDEQKIEFYWIDGERDLKMGKLADAKYCFKEILDLSPTHLGALEKCVLILVKLGKDWEKINSYVERIRQHYPQLEEWRDFAAAYTAWRKGRSFQPINQDKLREAEQFCVQGLNKNPKNPSLLYLHAMTLQNVGRNNEAREIFLQIVKDYPNDSNSFNYLGYIEFSLKNHDLAFHYVNRCLEFDDSHDSARMLRAQIHLARQECQLAQSDLRLLIAKGCKRGSLFQCYAHALMQQGQLESALDYLYFAFQLEPKNSKIQVSLRTLASQIFAQYPQNSKTYLKSLYCQAMLHLKNKNFSFALRDLNSLLGIDPAHFPARYAKSVCLFKMGRAEEAKAFFYLTLKEDITFSNSSLSSGEEDMRLTVWKKKGVALRSFQFEDIGQVVDFYDCLHSIDSSLLTIYNLEELNGMADVLQRRSNKENVEIVSLQVPHSAKIKGCAYFHFFIPCGEKKEICNIRLIHVADNYQKHGFGSLLLNYAIRRAIQRGCHAVKLDSTTAGIPLYASYGFTLANASPAQMQKWKELDIQGKIEFAKDRLVSLALDLKESSVLQNLELKLQKTLSQPFSKQSQ
jgi:tetratricopeptide (TPR) repeat protein